MNLTHIWPNYFEPTFHDHVDRLENDTIYRNDFHREVCKLEYNQWLKSPVWKATAKLKRLVQPYCEECGTYDHLEAHHRTYEHKGIEVLHLDDLVILCRECHSLLHNSPDFAYGDQRVITPDRVPTQVAFRFEPGRTSVQRHRVTWPPGR